MAKEINNFQQAKGVVTVSGVYLEAWRVCSIDFKKIEDLSEEQKLLKYYDISFSEDNENYIILLAGKILSDEDAKRFNRIIMGRETQYWVDKKTFKVNKRLFFK